LVFTWLLFYNVLRLRYVFPVISGFTMDIHIRIHHQFSTSFSECWLLGPLCGQWAPFS